MSNTHDLGPCPRCGEKITTGEILIRYETAERSETFAECPECLEVVHPQ